MSVALTTKPRTMWVATLGALVLMWTVWALRQHSNSTAVLLDSPSHSIDSLPKHDSSSTTVASPAKPHEPSSVSLQNVEVVNNQTASDRPLILYAYFETENSRQNLEFFIRHGLHGAADFLFILNGENEAEKILPVKDNIKWIKRKNDCYDLGAFAEVLLKDDLYKKYNRYITMNASIRGPFLPYWSNGCWSDMYLSRLTEQVKLVGMTFNCKPANHVQSMIWATDRIGLEVLLFPTLEQEEKTRASIPPFPENEAVPAMDIPGINSCPHEYWKAVAVEVYSTPLIKAAGYDVDAIMSAFHMSKHYQEECAEYTDVLYENSYFGTNIHPYDTVFAKANRGTNALILERLTEWMKGRAYSSYDFCHTEGLPPTLF